jgi:DNA-binding GntR family transcriptional regulator
MNRESVIATGDNRPRYVAIAEDLRLRIEAGEHALGSYLPTESELCDAYGASRHTVREALRRLIELGMIQRRQGSGSQVTAVRAHAGYVHSMRSLNELFQYAADTRFRIGSVRLAVPEPADRADLGEGADDLWLMAEGLRLERDQEVPICFSLLFINRAFAEIADDLPSISGAIYRHIEQRYGVEVALVEQEIRATPVPRAGAAALGIKPKALAVRVTRRYLGQDEGVMLVSVNYHPADRFSYTMRLRRGGGIGGWP